MKLSEKERRIYVAAHMNGAQSIADISRMSGYRDHVVRHALQAMEERSVLQTSLVLDEARLGIHHYRMVFNLAPRADAPASVLERAIAKSPIVEWFARTSGEYRHCIAFYVRDFSEVEKFLDDITDRFGPVISRKLIARGTGWTCFGRKYLWPGWKAASYLETGYQPENIDLDTTDSAIVAAVNAKPVITVSSLAREVNLPVTTTTFRLSRLQSQRVVGPALHRVKLSAAGVHSFSASIKTRFPSRKFATALFAYSAQHPNVVEFCRCVGGWDFELVVEAEDPSIMHSISHDLENLFPEYVESVLLLTRFDDLKWAADLEPIFSEEGQGKRCA